MTRGLTRGQIEFALSDYSGLQEWYCETCGKVCELKVIDGGSHPDYPRAEVISQCHEMPVTDINPVEEFEEEEIDRRVLYM